MVRQFRKKPVVISALQFTGDNVVAVLDFVTSGGAEAQTSRSGLTLYIKTLEGDMLASSGDWIIRGVKGEYYPCKPDVFADTYDPEPDDRDVGPKLPSPYDSFDERVWAESFVAHVKLHPSIATDVGAMLSWFASALMRGYDEAKAAERRACVTNRDVEARFAEQGLMSRPIVDPNPSPEKIAVLRKILEDATEAIESQCP